MLLHLLPDDKFSDYVIKSFIEVDAKQNEFIVISNFKKLTYVREKEKIRIKSNKEILSEEFLASIINYEAVFLHFLDPIKIKLVNKTTKYNNFVWVSWGSDFYNIHPDLKKTLLLEKTLKLFCKYNLKKNLFWKTKDLLDRFGLINNLYHDQEKALKKIAFMAPVIKEDYLLIKEHYKNVKTLEYLKFTYGNFDSLIKPTDSKGLGNNILLGNSSYFSNNHLEIIELLSKLGIKDQKVICPLSYGNHGYAKYIKKIGEQKFGANFDAMMDFIPLEVYFNKINSCAFLIMNHCRQQAMGNIYNALYNGARLFIRKDNPITHFLRRNALIFSSIEEIEREGLAAFRKLSAEDSQNNKAIISKLLDTKSIYKDLIAISEKFKI